MHARSGPFSLIAGVALAMIWTDAAVAQTGQGIQNSDGWTMPAGGADHAASGTKCPGTVTGFDHFTFAGPMGPALLGSCTYVDDTGNGDAGLRVRRYVPGAG